MNKLSLLSLSLTTANNTNNNDTNNSACFGRDEVEIVVFLLSFLNFDTLEMLISRGQVKNLFSREEDNNAEKSKSSS